MKVILDKVKTGKYFSAENFPNGSFFCLYDTLYIVLHWENPEECNVLSLCDPLSPTNNEYFSGDSESADYFPVEIDEIKAHLK